MYTRSCDTASRTSAELLLSKKNVRAYSDIYPCRNIIDQVEIRKYRARGSGGNTLRIWIIDTSFK